MLLGELPWDDAKRCYIEMEHGWLDIQQIHDAELQPVYGRYSVYVDPPRFSIMHPNDNISNCLEVGHDIDGLTAQCLIFEWIEKYGPVKD